MSQKFFRRNLVLLLIVIAAAFMVPAVAAQTADTIELVGTVENMTTNSITVNQQLVDVSTAQINTPIEIGAVVKVQGTLAADGTIVAREVNAPQNSVLPGEVEITGTLESFSGTIMIVGGQTIDVSAAQIGAGVAVGQTVKVHATVTGANTWQAREVSLFVAPPTTGTPVPPGPAGEFEVIGTLEQIGSGFIVVSGQNISIAGAEIKDALLVGVLVKAHVSQVNGALVAREVENAVGADDNTNANTNDNNTNANDNNANANANDNQDDANDNDDNINSNANDNNATAVVSMADAIAKVLAIYPNTTIASIELTTKFGGTLVWEVKTANRVEVIIDATTGVILTIDQSGGGNSGSGGSNLNNNDNHDDDNNNANNNSNDNNDDHGGQSGSDDGMGGDDSGGDGMG